MYLRRQKKPKRPSAIVLGAILVASWMWLSMGHAVAEAPGAVVGAVEGEAEMLTEGKIESIPLAAGSRVQAWNSVTTGRGSRLFLRWDDGVVTSSGEMSNIFLSTALVNGSEVPSFQVVGGIVRVAGSPPSARPTRYSVMTPAAHIQPESSDQPADFVVEVYDPSATLVTVLSGNVIIRSLKGGPAGEKIVSACQNAFISQDKEGVEALDTPTADIRRIVDNTTIPGTIVASLDECGITSALGTAPAPSYGYLPPEQYYVEEWDDFEFYPYEEITVLPPRPGVGCVILLPGLGEFIIPYAVLGGWVYDPVIVQVYARQLFLHRAIYHDREYLNHCRWKRRELHDAMYFAQLAGNSPLLRQAQRELDDLNIRVNWADRRIRRLDQKFGALENDKKKFGQQIPRGLNLDRIVNDSLASPGNVKLVQKFQNRIRTDLELQNRLASVAGKEIGDVRSSLARERDPRKRQLLMGEFTGLTRSISDGKVPIPQKQTEIKHLVTQLTKEKDPNNQENLQRKLINEIQTRQPAGTPEVLDPTKLNTLKQDLGRFPNPERQRDLEKRFSEFQHSLDARKGLEDERHRAEDMVNQAAKEKDPEKQKELLGKWRDLSVPLAVGGLGAAGVMQLRQRQQNLEKQVSDEKDAAKRTTLQHDLEDLKRREADLKQQENIRMMREKQLQQGQEEQRRKIQAVPRGQEEDTRRQIDQRGRELLDRQKQESEKAQQLQQQQQDQDRKQRLLRQQEDRAGQPERLKQRQEQLRLHQEKEKQGEDLRRLQEGRIKQESDAKLQEQRRRQQEKAQQEQLRQQQDRGRIEQQRQEQMRLQQERSKQEQMKFQQDRERQQQIRQQQDQQQQKMRQQQEQQQQMRHQQEQQQQMMKQQQEIQRQQQIRQQQEQQRQQQLRQQQEQQRQQQLKEEEERKKRK